MFSGIILDIGTIEHATDRNGGLTLSISVNESTMGGVKLGDSLAVNGTCLTIVKVCDDSVDVDVSRETLNCTTGLATQGARVNLERALLLTDRLNGHLVSGHIDGIGEVTKLSDLKESLKLSVRAPRPLLKYIAVKGSITINGTSLTINQTKDDIFDVNLIPYTLQTTTLGSLSAGDLVNIEIDQVARYVERIMQIQA